MTPKQIQLVQASYARIQPQSSRLAALFYGRLFELDASLRALFKADLTLQATKLADMLTTLVGGLDKLPRVLLTVEKLGKSHASYGVQPKHYETGGAALLWALKQELGNDFTPEVRDAWKEAYNLVANAMLDATPN